MAVHSYQLLCGFLPVLPVWKAQSGNQSVRVVRRHWLWFRLHFSSKNDIKALFWLILLAHKGYLSAYSMYLDYGRTGSASGNRQWRLRILRQVHLRNQSFPKNECILLSLSNSFCLSLLITTCSPYQLDSASLLLAVANRHIRFNESVSTSKLVYPFRRFVHGSLGLHFFMACTADYVHLLFTS